MQKGMPLEGLYVYERLIIFVTLTVIGLGLSLILDFPAAALMVAAVGAATGIGTASVLRAHPNMGLRPFLDSLPWWLLPTTLTVSACLFLRLFGQHYVQIAGVALTGLLLFGILTAQYHLLDPEDPYARTSRQGLMLATYLTAFVAMAAIYSMKTRSLQTGTALFVVATLLTYELLRDHDPAAGGSPASARRRWLYAAVIGLSMGETIWALNYLAISGLAGGALLLLTYYVASGVAHEQFAGRLNRARALEYGGISVLGLAMILSSRFFIG